MAYAEERTLASYYLVTRCECCSREVASKVISQQSYDALSSEYELARHWIADNKAPYFTATEYKGDSEECSCLQTLLQKGA